MPATAATESWTCWTCCITCFGCGLAWLKSCSDCGKRWLNTGNTLIHVMTVESAFLILFQYSVQSFLRDILVDYSLILYNVGPERGCQEQASTEFVWTFQVSFSEYCYKEYWHPPAYLVAALNVGCFMLVLAIWLLPVMGVISTFGFCSQKIGTGAYLKLLYEVRESFWAEHSF